MLAIKTISDEVQKTTCTARGTVPLKMRSSPMAFTFGTFESSLLADPTSFEEPLLDSSLCVVVDADLNVVSVLQEGFSAGASQSEESGTLSTLDRCIEQAKKQRKKLKSQLKL